MLHRPLHTEPLPGSALVSVHLQNPLPALSNFVSLPAEPGVDLTELYSFSLFQFVLDSERPSSVTLTVYGERQ